MVTTPEKFEEIVVGDIILYQQKFDDKVHRICHRVVEIKEVDGELFFQTKGDANDYTDADLVSSQDFIGRMRYYIPNVGNIAYISNLHTSLLNINGKSISMAFIVILMIGITIIGAELQNIWEWISRPHMKRRQEILKMRNQRIMQRRGRVYR